MERKLAGKNAVVTGGSRGIGRAICEALAKEGANIWFCYRSNEEQANITRQSIQESFPDRTVVSKQVDLNEPAACDAWVEEILAQAGQVDILVNNVGITNDKLLLMQSEEDFLSVLQANVMTTFRLTKSLGLHMYGRREGVILNLSSTAGLRGSMGQTNYSASKAAVIGFTRSCALEFGRKGVRVNAIAPGFIDTDMTQVLKNKEQLARQIPLQRFGKAEEIAKTAVFLCSDDAAYIHGAVIPIDGGLSV